MRKVVFGEANVGAVAGAVVGSIGGLFAIGVGPAIVDRNPARLFATPLLALISWIVSLLVGWVVGGQIGPRLGFKFRDQRAEIIGGVLGGTIPIILIGLLGWYLVSAH